LKLSNEEKVTRTEQNVYDFEAYRPSFSYLVVTCIGLSLIRNSGNVYSVQSILDSRFLPVKD